MNQDGEEEGWKAGVPKTKDMGFALYALGITSQWYGGV